MVDKYLSHFKSVQNKAYKLLFFYFKGVRILFEIGNSLKVARESSGVSMEEASKDINIKAVILENIENGNIGCFKDIFELRGYLTSYAKYLGLDYEKIIDEFNEYMFEYTSKIPLKEIEKQVMEQNKEKTEEKIVSPYSKPTKKYPTKLNITIYIVTILLVILIMAWSVYQIASSRLSVSEDRAVEGSVL